MSSFYNDEYWSDFKKGLKMALVVILISSIIIAIIFCISYFLI